MCYRDNSFSKGQSELAQLPEGWGVTILGVFQNQGMWHWADGQRAWGGGGMGVVASGFFSSLNGSVIPWVDTVGVG